MITLVEHKCVLVHHVVYFIHVVLLFAALKKQILLPSDITMAMGSKARKNLAISYLYYHNICMVPKGDASSNSYMYKICILIVCKIVFS